MTKRILLTALAVLCAAACTIKEDRSGCPCYLHVSFAPPDTAGTVQLLGWNEGVLFQEGLRIEEHRPYRVRPVRKGFFTLAACKGVRDGSLDGHEVTVRSGQQSDSLYAGHTAVDATGDLAYAEIALRKQFATVFLDIRKSPAQVRGYTFLVEGDTCGFDLLDFAPVPGPFRFTPTPREGEAIVPFRIPRQRDASLTVTVYPPGSPTAVRIPLGSLVQQLGYSWDTEELQDIYVAVDLVFGTIRIEVAGWEEGETFQLVEI